ncbi:putative Polycomb group protein ASXL2 isoform X2 [Pogona vitticeps]
MSHKEILHVIQKEGLKEIKSGTSPLACLNAMLHTNSRGEEGIFYKVPGRMGVYTLKKDVPDGLKDLSEGSEESSDGQSDSPTSENSSISSSSSSSGGDRSGNKEGQKNRWRRKVTTRLSQVSSPQAGCPSPLSAGKVISSSQKHSKKALKQALKRKQQRKQQECRASGPISSNHHLLQQHAKAAGHQAAPAKPAWEGKPSEGPSSSPPTSTSSSSPSVRAEPSLPVLGKKPFPRSDRLHARQLKRTKCAEIDVETPDSILVNTNLRALINKHTFSLLPVDGQQRLLLLLPEVDRQAGVDGLLKLSTSALNNEFFTSAAQGWKERLSEGEFTPEMQLRLRQELEKEKKVEPWKERFFESYYGQSSGLSPEEARLLTSSPTAVQRDAPARSTGTLLQKGPPASVAGPPGGEAAGPPARGTKTPDLSACHVEPAVAAPGKEEAVSPAPSPVAPPAPARVAEMPGPLAAAGGPSWIGGQAACRPSLGVKAEDEPLQGEPGEEEAPAPAKSSSQPKSPAAGPGPGSPPEKEAQGRPPKEEDVAAALEPMDTAGGQALKRRTGAPEEEGLATPEKRPLLTEQSPSRPPFQAPPQHFPTPPVPKVPPLRIPISRIQRGPAPFPAGQCPPRASPPLALGGPRRTGARTLADIKARAQMARAQRAAAAAAAAASLSAAPASLVGTIPGPGPGGGRAEEGRGPAPGGPRGAALGLVSPGGGAGPGGPGLPPPDPWPPTQRPASGGAARTQLQPAPTARPGAPAETSPPAQPAVRAAPSPSLGVRGPPSTSAPGRVISWKASPAPTQDSQPASGFGAPVSGASPPSPLLPISQASSESFKSPPPPPPPASPAGAGLALPSSPWPAAPASLNLTPSSSGASRSPAGPARAASSTRIPANNPLVAQLLQGKEVPLEQILPKPLVLRVEMKTVALPVAKAGQEPPATPRLLPPRDAAEGRPPLLSFPSGGRALGSPLGGRPAPGSAFSQPDQLGATSAGLGSCQEASGPAAQEPLCQGLTQRGTPRALPAGPPPPPHLPASRSFVLGFAGRRTSRPAMSGHYLLNISTYGRCPENLRRSLAVPPPESCLGPEEEEEEEEEEEPDAGGSSAGVSDKEEGGEAVPCDAEHHVAHVVVQEETPAHQRGEAGAQGIPRTGAEKGEQGTGGRKEGGRLLFSAGQGDTAERSTVARDFLQTTQTVTGERRPRRTELCASAPVDVTSPRPQLFSPSPPPRFFGGPGAAPQLVRTGYSGTINVSTSPDLHQEALLSGLSDPSGMGDVVSFSVTVTTIPSGQARSASGGLGQPLLHGQAFSEDGGLEDLPSKCYCRLKAMIVCKGCGAFCHDDCIGPSKLCVACLVVR